MLDLRIKHKKDTEVNWAYHNPVLLDGEVALVEDISGKIRLKVGDGSSRYSDLSFLDSDIYSKVDSLADVATSGSYSDLSDTPTPYTLPTASHSTLGGVKVGTNLSISDGVLSATDTTYSEATTNEAGLLSPSDKEKIDSVSPGANNYTHPDTHPSSMITGLSPVATSGSYADLSDLPEVYQLPVVITEGTNTAYTATISGITELVAGLTVIIIPHVDSNSTSATLNINNLGDKQFRRLISNQPSIQVQTVASFLKAGLPCPLVYTGTYWLTITYSKPFATDLSGITSVANGGTGNSTLTKDSYLVGNGTSSVTLKTPTEVRNHIDAAPSSHKHKFTRERVVIAEDGTTSISIPTTIFSDSQSNSDYILVYQNGLLLERDLHYIHDTETTIALVDTSSKSGDVFSFVRI